MVTILALILLFAYPASATVLGDAAAALSAGQWSSVTTVSGGGYDFFSYLDGAAWDSVNGKMRLLMGNQHGNGTKHFIYDQATNTMSDSGPTLSSVASTLQTNGYHAYDNTMWDSRNGKMYFHVDNAIMVQAYGSDRGTWPATDFVYTVATDSWANLPSNVTMWNQGSSCCDSAVFFPERHGFYIIHFYAGPDTSKLWFFNVDTQAWSAIADLAFASTWNSAEYNHLCKCAIILDQSTRKVARINLDGSITNMSDIVSGLNIYDGEWAGNLIADPMSKNFLVTEAAHQNTCHCTLKAYRYDPIADTWTSITAPPTMVGQPTSFAVPELGVMAMISCGDSAPCTPKLLLYKMTDSTAADQDYATRCAARGVTICNGFNNIGTYAAGSDLVLTASDTTHGNLRNANYFGTPVSRASISTTTKRSGVGSLQFKQQAGDSFADISGSFLCCGDYNAPDTTNGLGAHFGNSSTFYVQYALRFSQAFIDNMENYWQQTPKFSIFHKDGNSCAGKEVTGRFFGYNRDLLSGYTSCSAPHFFTDQDGFTYGETTSPPYLIHQGAYFCDYGIYSDCWHVPPDTWITFLWKVHIGNFGSNNSSLESWYAVDGTAYVKWLNITANWTWACDTDCTSEYFNNLTLTNYITGGGAQASPVDSYTWYDELIVSSQNIAAPGQPPPAPPTVNVVGRRRIM